MGMRGGNSFSQESGESRKDTDLSLVCDSTFGSAVCGCDDLFRLGCRGISEYWRPIGLPQSAAAGQPDFLMYRLLTSLTEAINTCLWLYKDLLQRSLRQNPLSLRIEILTFGL